MGETHEELAIRIIELTEVAKAQMELLRSSASEWNGRALSIAITELETAQLWFANARPD